MCQWSAPSATPRHDSCATLGQQSSASDNGNVGISAAAGNEIVGLFTKLVVPPKPPRVGTLYLWPGLQPRRGADYYPIDNGVLQPVLTWGPSPCAAGKQPEEFSTWWISGQYVNSFGNYTGYEGCHSGPVMAVNPKDQLLIGMSLFQSIWTQTVLVLGTTKYTDFHFGLGTQAQGFAWFSIEPYDGAISSDVEFLQTTIGFARPDPTNCKLEARGPDDEITAPISIGDGRSCYIEKITLKPPPPPQPQSAKPRAQFR